MKVFLVDIDGTCCEDIMNEDSHLYPTAKVIEGSLEQINKWYDEGNHITFFTAREEKDREVTKLEQEFEAYKKLMPDLDVSRFSDFYAQTITYGLFIVRYLNSVSQIGSSFLEEAFSILSSKKIDDRITEIYNDIQALLLQIDLTNIVWEYSGDVVIHLRFHVVNYRSEFLKQFLKPVARPSRSSSLGAKTPRKRGSMRPTPDDGALIQNR